MVGQSAKEALIYMHILSISFLDFFLAQSALEGPTRGGYPTKRLQQTEHSQFPASKNILKKAPTLPSSFARSPSDVLRRAASTMVLPKEELAHLPVDQAPLLLALGTATSIIARKSF